MKNPSAELASIVLLGNFNPAIIHPQWCAAHDVISSTEAEEAKIEVSVPQVTKFNLSWGTVQVTLDQFVINSRNPTFFNMINDFVLKTFGLLSHTPISALGINLEQKYISDGADQHIAFGDHIAPKEKWLEFMKKPGLRDIVMEEQERPDQYKGYIQARIQSLRSKEPSILVSVNDHYYIEKNVENDDCESMVEILQNNWSPSIDRSRSIIKNICEKFS